MDFYLYTTGILNRGRISESHESIIDKWKNHGILSNILSLIPERYINIHIIHSDICEFESDMRELVNEILLLYDMSHERVKTSIYITDELNFKELHTLHDKKHYILIDFAHLFAYPNIPKDKDKIIKKILTRTNLVQNIDAFLYMGTFNLNSVYCTFIGNYDYIDREFNRLSSIDFMNSKFFNVNDDGTITTYIDMMIELDYEYDKIYPEYILKEMYIDIKKNIIRLWKDKYGTLNMNNENTNLNTFDNMYNKCIPSSAELGDMFMTLLMNKTSKDDMKIIILNRFITCLHLD